MIVTASAFFYLGIGFAWAYWAHGSFDSDSEWLAVAPLVVLFWGPLTLALIAVRIWHEVILRYRRRTR